MVTCLDTVSRPQSVLEIDAKTRYQTFQNFTLRLHTRPNLLRDTYLPVPTFHILYKFHKDELLAYLA